MAKSEDILLIENILNGDVSAFKTLVNNYKSYVFNLVIKIVDDYEDAEEVSMDVFLNVYKSLKNFRQNSNFTTWLYRIAYNASLNKLKSRKQNFTSFENEEIFWTEYEQYDDENEVFIIEKALKKLNDIERTIVHLYYYEDISVKEISEITGNSIENIKVILYRCRKKLYDLLKDKIDEKKLIFNEI